MSPACRLGFADLDKMIFGLPGRATGHRVAGRPSMGKTSFSMNIGEHVAIEQGTPGGGLLDGKWARCSWPVRMLGSVGMLDQSSHAYRQAGRAIVPRHPRGCN